MEISKKWMLCILLTKDSFVCNTPVYSKTVIYYRYSTICVWMIELTELVLEYCRFTQNGKTMCEATGYEELAMIILSQLHCYMLAVSGATFTDVHSNVKHSTFDTTNQFALGKWWTLEMQPTHHTICAHALVVLNKMYGVSKDWGYFFIEFSL